MPVPRIEAAKLKPLLVEVDALDRLPRSLDVLERAVKLVAEGFSATVLASYRSEGSASLLDLRWGSPSHIMVVKLDDDRQYHCYHMIMGDQYEKAEPTTSSAAWYFIVGRPYPSVWPEIRPRSPASS